MFRSMRRNAQMMSDEEAKLALRRASHGTLALSGDDGYPYSLPISYVYSEEDGAVYFHSALSGHKIDAVKNSDKASFSVVAMDEVLPEEYTTVYKSVIVFGRISIVSDESEKHHALIEIAKRYAPSESRKSMEKAVSDFWPAVNVLKLSVEHISGKKAKELIGK